MKEFLVGLFVATSVHAAAPLLPNTGSILQRVQPQTAPSLPPNSPGLMPDEDKGKAKQFSNETFVLGGIRITNNTLFDTATLSALVADAQGKSLTLSDLTELAARITDTIVRMATL
jgi:hemolysin activation/secretion protein